MQKNNVNEHKHEEVCEEVDGGDGGMEGDSVSSN